MAITAGDAVESSVPQPGGATVEQRLDLVAGPLRFTGCLGLMAGVFGLYANAILPGLRTTDDRTFVGAFQSIDEAITNPLFLATFVGVLVVTGVAAVLHLRQDGRSVLPWTVAVFILYLAVFVITVRVNVPLNDEIKDAGDPDRIADLAAVRERFDEAKWVRWNIVRR